MNILTSRGIRTAFAALLMAAGLAPAASAATSEFSILLNTDRNPSGCDVPTANGVFGGVEQILITTVETSGTNTAQVTQIDRQVCMSPPSGFGARTPVDTTDRPVGVGLGTGGSDVIETYLPLSLIPPSPGNSPRQIRLGVTSLFLGPGGGQDALTSRNGNGNAPIDLRLEALSVTDIPTLSEWGLIFLGLVLAAAAVAMLRRRSAAAFLMALVLLGGAGIAWAAASDLNGNTTGEWGGAHLADDPAGDAPEGADIRAFFGMSDSGTGRVYFRLDADLKFNDAPRANDDTATVAEDAPATPINVLANDTDLEGDPFTIASVVQPAHGTVVITGGGTGLTYQPDPNYCNTPPGAPLDGFTYTLTPGGDSALVTVTVTCTDDNPTAVNDAATVAEDSSNNPINVLANDTDPDGGTKLVTAVNTAGTNGSVSIVPGGTGVTYTPNANYCNTQPGGTPDTFTYTITGGSTATVAVTVTCGDDAPTAVDDAATVAEDAPATAVPVLANDTDLDAGPISIQSVTQPANGTVVITGGGTGLTYQPNPNYCNTPPGTTLDTFTYTLTPGGDSATVSMTVTCADDAPTAVDDAATVAEDAPATAVPVLANDTDPDGGPISITAVTQPTNGAVVITGGGTGLTYQPNPNYCNTPPGTALDTFTYTLTPGGDTATVTMTVTCTDDNPTAVNDAATVAEDSGANPIPVLANDTDPDGGPISIQSVTQPANGTVVITGGGTGLTYQPNANFCTPGAPETFTYTLTPGGSTATVTVTVTCADDNPVAVLDAATVAEDSGANPINVLANDTDLDGGPISIQSVTQPANGAVVITGGGTGLTYAPNANYCNTPPGTTPDTFTYTLTPGGSTATVSVSVTCTNDGPVVDLDANNDQGTTGNDFAVTFVEGNPATLIEDPLDATVTDVDNTTLASLTVTITNLLDIGSETLSTDVTGTSITATYVLAPGTGVLTLTGPDTVANFVTVLRKVRYLNTDNVPDATPRVINFVANDGTTNGNTAVSTVTIVSVDTSPTAVNDAATVSEDSGATAIPVLANDTDPDGGPISIQSVTQPAGGSVVITGGGTGLTFQPNANFCTPGAPATFTYSLAPGGSTATVSVSVTCLNDAPVVDLDGSAPGNDFAATFTEGNPATLIEDPLDATVTDIDSATLASLTVTLTNLLDVGSETLSADVTGTSITAIYVPGTGVLTLTGPDTVANFQTVLRTVRYLNTDNAPDATPRVIHFVANDGTTNGNTAVSTVTVVSVDTSPTAVNDAATVNEDSGATAINVLANDTDPDGGPISITSVTQPANGTVVITGGGTGLTFQPNANFCTPGAPVTFTYTLTPGGSTATVSVTVTCIDDNPVAVADAATVNEDSGANAIPVLANDTDADGGPISITSVTQPANGAVVITGGGTGLTYAPNANYCNSVSGVPDTFTYTLTPGGSSATVSVTVTCVDDNPVAVADATTVVEDSGATPINVLANDTDVDGGPISITSVTQPAGGAVAITGGGTGLTYTPNPNFCTPGAPDTFTYTLTPGGSTATVSVTVTCVDDPPVAVNDAATVNEDAAATAIPVLANDTDPDAGPISITSVTQPTGGTVVITGGGTGLTFQPNANFCTPGAPVTFTYTLTPGGSTATVSVTVNCVNDPPVADNDTFDFIGNTDLVVDLAALATPHALETTPSGLGVVDGDSDPVEGDAISVTAITVGACTDASAPLDCSDPAVGRVQMQPNGRFIFTPAPGDTGATETFQYTLTDNGVPAPASTTATVTLTRFERVWYVKNDAPAGGNGTSSSPFNSITPANLSDNDGDGDLTDDLDVAGDYIFVYFGTGTTANQAGGLVLENNQHLIGQHAGLSLNVNLNANGAPTNLVAPAAGSRPLLDDTVVDAFEGVSARNVIPAEIVGMNLAGNVNGIDWTTTAAFAGTGAFSIRDNVIRSATNEGVDVNLAGTGATSLAFHDNNLTASGAGLDIQETGTGALTITRFENNVVSGDTGGSGIVVTSPVTFDATPGGALDPVSGGTTVIGSPGNSVGGAGLVLSNVTGALDFTDLDVFAGGGAGVSVTGTGAYTGAAGTRMMVGAGVGIIEATGNAAVDLTNMTADFQLSSLRSINTSTRGVSLTSVSDGTTNAVFSAGSGSSITTTAGATGPVFNVSGGNAKITYGGTITNTGTGRAVSITTWSGDDAVPGDDLLLSGAIDENGAGILLNGNGGSRAITFSGGMDIDTTNGEGFAATTNTNTLGLHITGTNTIDSISATALRVTSTPIGLSNLNFQRISSGNNTAAADPANGIVLSSTGTSGGLVVTGSGGACTEGSSTCTGGWIQNMTGGDDSGATPGGTGIVLNNTVNVSLSRMRINDTSNYGIRGTSVSNFTFTNSVVDGVNGTNVSTPFNEGSLVFFGVTGTSSGMTGTSSISNSTIMGGRQRNIAIDNSVGTLNLTVSGSTIKRTSDAAGDDGLFLEADTSANVTLAVTNNTFARHGGDHINVTMLNNSVVDLTITGNTLHGNYPGTPEGNHPIGLSQGIFIFGATFNGTCTYEISNNGTVGVPFRGNRQVGAIHVNKGSGTGTFSGSIENNVIGDPAVTGSGSSEAFGIIIGARGAGSHTTLINNNQVRQYFDRGIVLEAGEGSAALNATVTNNTVSNFADAVNSLHGIHSDNGILAADTNPVCLQISGNSVATAGNEPAGGADIRLRRGSNTTVRLPGVAGATNANATTLLQANNPTATTITVTGNGFSSGAACPLP
jgi:VCBS repeat-containing protein